MKLNPIVLDNQIGVSWKLEIRGQLTLKKFTALVKDRIFSRSLAIVPEMTLLSYRCKKGQH